MSTFRWQGRNSCKAKVYCPLLNGNICGDYGIDLLRLASNGTLASTEAFCYEGELSSFTMKGGEYITLRLWYHKHIQHESKAQCFLWCNGNGNLPQRPKPDQETMDKIKSFKRDHGDLIKLLPNGGSQTISVSSQMVYEVSGDGSQGCQGTKLCKSQKSFMWHHKSRCISSFICTQLNGNVCGDFGISLMYGPDSKSKKFSSMSCFEENRYLGLLKDDNHLHIYQVHKKWHQYNVTCYFWCTSDGQLPQPLPSYPESSIVQDTKSAFSMKQEFLETSMYLSPVVMYQIDRKKGSGESCRSRVCHNVFKAMWINKDICEYKSICSKLDSGFNADHGLKIKDPQNTQQFKQANFIIHGRLEFGEALYIDLWYTRSSNFTAMKCYLWCRVPEGNLEPPSNDFLIGADLLQTLVRPLPIFSPLNTSKNRIMKSYL